MPDFFATVSLSVPILVVAYCGLKCNTHSAFSRFLRISLFFAATLPVLYHVSCAMELGKQRRLMESEFRKEIAAEIPLPAVAGSFGQYWSWSAQSLQRGMERLRDAGAAPYASLPEMPPTRSIPLQVSQEGPRSAVILKVTSPERVLAVELEYTVESAGGLSALHATWDRGSADVRERIGSRTVFVKPMTGSPRKAHLIWINDHLSDLRIEVVDAGALEVHSANLLLPARQPDGTPSQ